MFYFSHSTNFNNFRKIIRSSYIYAPYYAPYQLRGLSITTKNSKYIFTNLFVNDLPLKDDEKKGFGEVSIIIDPVILKYKICYFNPGWTGGIDSKTIIMNNNIDFVLDLAKKNYRYPYLLANEALFNKKISTKFIIGIVCRKKYKYEVREILDKYRLYYVKIFDHYPNIYF